MTAGDAITRLPEEVLARARAVAGPAARFSISTARHSCPPTCRRLRHDLLRYRYGEPWRIQANYQRMAALELAPGTVLAERYRLECLIGEGGMGVIWAAEDIVTGQHIALKLMKDPVEDPAARRRFLHEARAASVVRHPNVVRIFDVLELESGPAAIVMERLEGESLRDLLVRERKLSLPVLADIAVPVVSAVGAAHALGIVHRDLKPENIFLARSAGARIVKVLDFGIAKLTALDGDAMRSTGLTTTAVLGTPAYMAPEQVFGERDIDHRADVWALGVVLYECLSGVRPTDGENVGQILKHVLARPFLPLTQLVSELPSEVSQLVDRMLARERSRRPTDLHAVLDVLEPLTSTRSAPFDGPAEHFLRGGDDTALQPAEQKGSGPPTGFNPFVTRVREIASVPGIVGARRRARRGVSLGSAAVLVLLGMGTAWWYVTQPNSPQSPLADPNSRIACPILRASGVDEPAGWLGATVAAMACERARVLLGGRRERTLVPAQLLNLPREPADTFPEASYDKPNAIEATKDAAQQRAQAYLEGEVTLGSQGFTVALSLHRANGVELEHSVGRSRDLYAALRSAMEPLIGTALIPKASKLDPEIAAWSRTEDVDAALAVLDLTFAFVQNAGGLQNECDRFDTLSTRVRELGIEARWWCAYNLGRAPPSIGLDTSDQSEAGRATRIRVDHCIAHKEADPVDLQFLGSLFQHEATLHGRSLVAATESCLLQSRHPADPEEARQLAIAAVRSEPNNPDGGCCNPWEHLLTLERNTAMGGAIRAMQAWVPWNSYAWLEPGFEADDKNPDKNPEALRLRRRAYVLSPLDSLIAHTLARGLLAAGDKEAARGIAADLRKGGLPLHHLESDLILVEIETSAAHFGDALRRARDVSAISRSDAGWVLVQRFEAGWHALELAILLGRGHEIADDLVNRFLAPDPSPLDPSSPFVPSQVPAICVNASEPMPCLKRFRSLLSKLPGAITTDTDALLTGAVSYAKGDYIGAAEAWRPLLEGSMVLVSALPDAMVIAFENARAPELAERVDKEVMNRAASFNGATLGHVREAHRAFKRRDFAAARQLAKQVLDAWSFATPEPPAVEEMRQLIAKLPQP